MKDLTTAFEIVRFHKKLELQDTVPGRIPVAILEKKHQCHVLSIFNALHYGNGFVFLCSVCLSISPSNFELLDCINQM